MSDSPPVLNVHTPTASFAILHSLNQDTLQQLFDKLSRKSHTDFHGKRVGPGWAKYHWNDSVWNLDDDSDYTIFVWRQKSPSSTSDHVAPMPTLHVYDPKHPLPSPPAYCNPSFYLFRPSKATSPPPHSVKSGKSRKTKDGKPGSPESTEAFTVVAKHRKDFERFHSENGVRTVMGSIGPVDDVRMLLKKGYRHVYISRKFALKHGFIPADAAPGHYGYGGLVNLGKWPITLNAAGQFPISAQFQPSSPTPNANGSAPRKSKTVSVPVFLSEEPHFDVVLGRSFFEHRQIKTSTTDPTEVICLDNGDKIECELVILKDGRGEIVIVT
ncbi:hypothetical protein BJ138DRAFT_1091529 [Hygrophoropsis aurantiaca]|uniref:Uncharacterized protein n=1 Tax=Hygrophoropsis aurantiaca TaxID=72124 RepID=A0ACB8A527_9AGAM|nr:hypothetical protein BJ138DRAFT_1091529 [Hygrophoropsis aurantiaca]